MKKLFVSVLMMLAFISVFFTVSVFAKNSDAICYNCPPAWANWGEQLALIKRELGIAIPMDNKNSGQALAQIIAEKNNPVADVVYYGVSFGIKAAEENVVASFKPKNWNKIPAGLKDPNGKWFAIHSGAIGLFINKDALDGAPVPQSWSDLLKPKYRGIVAYYDPTSAFVGYASAVAINLALGGSLDDFEPVVAYFKKLKKNRPIIPKQTSYARVLSGEIPILVDYDFNAYRAQYKNKANAVFIIPKEGSLLVPYVMSKVKNAPHPTEAEKILDFVLSEKGQRLWAKAFLRPVIAGAQDAESRKKFLPESEYKRATTVDFAKLAAVQKTFVDTYRRNAR